MATITKSIGATGRDYSTIASWEADLDNGAVYASGDDAVGECYDDAAFDPVSTIIDGGGTIGLNSVRLTVAAGHRHDGTAGTGARAVLSTSTNFILSMVPLAGTAKLIVEWLELNANGRTMGHGITSSNSATAGRIPVLRNCLLQGMRTNVAGRAVVFQSTRETHVLNCIVWDSGANGSNRDMIGIDSRSGSGLTYNNTVHGIFGNGTGTGRGIQHQGTSGSTRNNISVGNTYSFIYSTTSANCLNNLSDDDRADDGGGSGHLINQTLANLFVSTTAGSEDFHLKASSPAIRVGSSTPGTTNGANVDIDGYDRTLSSAWDIGADQFVRTTTKSIGASGRDYATITAWEADLDNAAVYSAGDDVVGECYDDAAFDENVVLDGGSTLRLNSVQLSVAAGHRHDGTAGTGARIVKAANFSSAVLDLFPFVGPIGRVVVEWLEVDANGFQPTVLSETVRWAGAVAGRLPVVRWMLVHGVLTTGTNVMAIGGQSRTGVVHGNIVYDYKASGNNRTLYGIRDAANQTGHLNANNTVFDVQGHGTGAGVGINIAVSSTLGTVRNNIAVQSTSTGAGTPTDFLFAASPLATLSNNLSGDATADDGGGSNHLINQTIASLFVSTTVGSEDLHLKSGSPAIDTGFDIGTTNGVNFDIDGRDRDALNDVWDIGADEFVASGGASYSITGAGGLVLGGAITPLRNRRQISTGGIALSGQVTTAQGRTLAAAGGLTFAGVSSPLHGRAIVGSGNLTFAVLVTSCGGAALAGTGGTVFTGTAPMVRTQLVAGIGNMTFAGVATPLRGHITAGAGNLTFAGVVTSTAGRTITGAGGLDLTGTDIPRRGPAVRGMGGVSLTGLASFSVLNSYTLFPAGGVVFTGTDGPRRGAHPPVSGQIAFSGQADVLSLYNFALIPAGGLDFSGASLVRRNVSVVGAGTWLLAGGADFSVLNSYSLVSTGGAVFTGTDAPRRGVCPPAGGQLEFTGEADVTPRYNFVLTPDGGMIFGGTSPVNRGLLLTGAGVWSLAGSGGFSLQGSHSVLPTGGVLFTGTDAPRRQSATVGVGSLVLEGSASSARGRVTSATGGIAWTGATTTTSGRVTSVAGGLTFSGVADQSGLTLGGFSLTGSGTILLSGIASVIRASGTTGSGSISFPGVGQFRASRTIAATGGVTFTGITSHAIGYGVWGSGGIAFGGGSLSVLSRSVRGLGGVGWVGGAETIRGVAWGPAGGAWTFGGSAVFDIPSEFGFPAIGITTTTLETPIALSTSILGFAHTTRMVTRLRHTVTYEGDE